MTDATLELTDNKKLVWGLLLEPERLVLTPRGHQAMPVEVARFDLAHKVEFMRFGAQAVMNIAADTKVGFHLKDEPAIATIEAWIGPPTPAHLRVELAKRLGWTLTIGASFMLIGLGTDPQGGVQITDPFNFVLGFGLAAIGTFSKFLPHRIFFLLDSAWFLPIAWTSGQRFLAAPGFFNGFLALLPIIAAWSGINTWRRFAVMRDDSDPLPP